MALEGEFLTEVRQYVAQRTKRDDAVILDAATGAGETTLQIAEAMNGGRLITADRDRASWDDWALPALKDAGVLERVEFLEADICELPLEAGSIDLVVSDATLSAVDIHAVDAIRQFHRVLKPGGRLALRDLIPERETDEDPENISAASWRLMKAAAHLAGREHYEELPVDWVARRLKEAGFDIRSLRIDRSRRPASEASHEEWRGLDSAAGVVDADLAKAIRDAQGRLVLRAEEEGLTAKTGQYECWARK